MSALDAATGRGPVQGRLHEGLVAHHVAGAPAASCVPWGVGTRHCRPIQTPGTPNWLGAWGSYSLFTIHDMLYVLPLSSFVCTALSPLLWLSAPPCLPMYCSCIVKGVRYEKKWRYGSSYGHESSTVSLSMHLSLVFSPPAPPRIKHPGRANPHAWSVSARQRSLSIRL